MKKIAFLGTGAWGFALANLLASNGHEVRSWTTDPQIVAYFKREKKHPRFPHIDPPALLSITGNIEEALEGVDMIVESVTSVGLRSVLHNHAKQMRSCRVPFVITSKGIEQNTCLLLHEVAVEELGVDYQQFIGCISGPSLADEVINKHPTSVVCSGYSSQVALEIQEAFNNLYFRVYPNTDISGVEFGGAMKNIIAIACGISDGLGFGGNTKAAIMTRGLHEIRKLSVSKGCNPETLNGLAGLGDLCVTCLSVLSRNYRFGSLLAKGLSPKEAKSQIGMVVEGANTCVSACQLGERSHIPIPISQAIYQIIYKEKDPREMVKALLSREIKEERL